MAFDCEKIRAHFPSLSEQEQGRVPVFLDNPAGTQVPQEVFDAVHEYYLKSNANHGGVFPTSIRSDAMIQMARSAMADLIGAASPDEIIFGPNMTTLTFGISRAIGRILKAGDEIVVTRLDHDANIAPWLALEEERGVCVKWADIHPEDCTLDMTSLETALTRKTKIVAVCYASNAVGTINDIQCIIRLAHDAGAMVFVDAVQYAPHGPIDVRSLECDFLACSAYKFFGPHIGALYGRYDLLDRLPAYKVRPAGDLPPDKFETGTQNHECIAGTIGALSYLEWLGAGSSTDAPASRRQRLLAAMAAIKAYEQNLSRALIEGLRSIPSIKIWGITDLQRLEHRVPTVSFTHAVHSPCAIAEYLASRGIYVWDGNYYALAIMERLRLQAGGGMVRIGPVHYNTAEEVQRLVDILREMPAGHGK